jgi:hypothetical protein
MKWKKIFMRKVLMTKHFEAFESGGSVCGVYEIIM